MQRTETMLCVCQGLAAHAGAQSPPESPALSETGHTCALATAAALFVRS
jgi:hypothetical protein